MDTGIRSACPNRAIAKPGRMRCQDARLDPERGMTRCGARRGDSSP